MSAWAAIAGAARWLTCSPAEPVEAARRAAKCEACPSRVLVRVRGVGLLAAFCGAPMTETSSTCGCLVQWGRELDALEPAGKATCAGEACPQGRWNPPIRGSE